MGVHRFEDMPLVMRRYAQRIMPQVRAALNSTALAGHARMVDTTPVDTGRAVSNWRLTGGSPATGTVASKAPGSSGGVAAGFVRNNMKGQARRTVLLYKGDKIYVTNNLDYIGVLEHGGVNRKPYGMFRKGIQAARIEAKRALKAIRLDK